MIYLLGQIALCLLVAVLVGWYVGWTWRGFRAQDAVEDARRTLHATQEVKDRELTAAYRRADSLQSRADAAQRQVESLQRQVRASSDGPAETTEREATSTSSRRSDAPLASAPPRVGSVTALGDAADTPAPPAATDPSAAAAEPLTGQRSPLAEQSALLAELRATLRERTVALTAASAEAKSLRASIAARAEETARLQARIIELEPALERLSARSAELTSTKRDLEQSRAAAERARRQQGQVAEQLRQLQEQLDKRDARMNQLRTQHNDAIARLQQEQVEATAQWQARVAALEARLSAPAATDKTATPRLASLEAELARHVDREADLQRELEERTEALDAAATERQRSRAELTRCSALLQQLEGKLEQACERLNRQIARNRKQEAIHRTAIASLEARLADETAGANTDTEIADLRSRLIAEQRRSERLQRRLHDTEELVLEQASQKPFAAHVGAANGPSSTPHRATEDDLTAIDGIGPQTQKRLHALGIHNFDQIADWSDDDIERIGRQLGVFPGRIRRDDWVGGARREIERRR